MTVHCITELVHCTHDHVSVTRYSGFMDNGSLGMVVLMMTEHSSAVTVYSSVYSAVIQSSSYSPVYTVHLSACEEHVVCCYCTTVYMREGKGNPLTCIQ